MASSLALDALRAGFLAMIAVVASEFIIAYRVSEPITKGDNAARCQTGFGKSLAKGTKRPRRVGRCRRAHGALAGTVRTRGRVAGRTCARPGRPGTGPRPAFILWRGPLVEPAGSGVGRPDDPCAPAPRCARSCWWRDSSSWRPERGSRRRERRRPPRSSITPSRRPSRWPARRKPNWSMLSPVRWPPGWLKRLTISPPNWPIPNGWSPAGSGNSV